MILLHLMEAIKTAMSEVRKIHAQRKVANALAMRNGPNVTETLSLPLYSEVLVYREKRGWTGPWKLLVMEGMRRPMDQQIFDLQL